MKIPKITKTMSKHKEAREQRRKGSENERGQALVIASFFIVAIVLVAIWAIPRLALAIQYRAIYTEVDELAVQEIMLLQRAGTLEGFDTEEFRQQVDKRIEESISRLTENNHSGAGMMDRQSLEYGVDEVELTEMADGGYKLMIRFTLLASTSLYGQTVERHYVITHYLANPQYAEVITNYTPTPALLPTTTLVPLPTSTPRPTPTPIPTSTPLPTATPLPTPTPTPTPACPAPTHVHITSAAYNVKLHRLTASWSAGPEASLYSYQLIGHRFDGSTFPIGVVNGATHYSGASDGCVQLTVIAMIQCSNTTATDTAPVVNGGGGGDIW